MYFIYFGISHLESVLVSNDSAGVEERSKSSTGTNRKRRNNPSIFNCTKCKELVCQHCSLDDHRDHNCELMESISLTDMITLEEDIYSLKILNNELTNASEKIKNIVDHIEAKKRSTINSIHTNFKELHNILERREQELVDDATSIAQEKLQNLSQQEKTLSLASAEIQSVIEYTEQSKNLASVVTSLNVELRKILQHKKEKHSKSGRSLELIEEADMAVEVTCSESLQQLCLTQANITTAVDPAKCTVDLKAPAEVGKPYVGTLTTRLSNGKPNNRKCKVTCHIKSLYKGITTNCVIDNDGPGRYSIQYIPTVRGRHELTVLINGHHVAGSPFPVYVSIHPTQLGKPVNIWTGITKPQGITANSKGEIFVALHDGTPNIVKYDAEGKRVDLVKKNCLVMPCCIACDEIDNIYCGDGDSNKILRCDSNGDNLKIRNSTLHKGSYGQTALAIIDQKLFMAEDNFIGVKIYDKQLQYLRSISYDMCVMDISFSIHQNLFVSDSEKSCVHVFTMDGVHLRLIGDDKEELKFPNSLCVHGQYVYVTDTTSHCVFVFTTDGEYITSFGKEGQEVGDFDYPKRVCVDNNDFVYVCDFHNNRIQCF